MVGVKKDQTTAPVTSLSTGAQAQQDAVSDGIENYELPKTLVTKIAKSALPDNAKLQKETVTALVKGSTVFINYLAATAHDIALSRQHKSISASDVLKALELIQFGDAVDGLQEELRVYREMQQRAGKKGGQASSKAKGKGKAMTKVTNKVVESASSVSRAGPSVSGGLEVIEHVGSVPASTSASASLDVDQDMVDVDAAEEDEDEGGFETAEADEEDFDNALDPEEEVDQLDADAYENEGDGEDQELLEDPMLLEDDELSEERQRLAHLGQRTHHVE